MNKTNSILFAIMAFCLGFAVAGLFNNAIAQTSFCDNEAYIYLFNNDLNGLFACINYPDIQQDIKLEQLESKVEIIENKTRIDVK